MSETKPEPRPTPPARPPLSRRKRLLFQAIILVSVLIFFEAGARLIFFVSDDFNPFYLTFGFVNDSEAGAHTAQFDGYTKFQPNIPKRKKLDGEVVEMQVNSDGFRGRSDFVRPKPPGTFRIVTLGASSTFGFHNPDDETHPVYLEQDLRSSHPGRAIEVYNLGIPHLTSENLLALARAELPSLQPDLITIYSGCNDSVYPEERKDFSLMFRAKEWMYWHSVGWRAIHAGVKRIYHAYVTATNSDPVGVKNMDTPLLMPRQRVETMRDEAAQRYHDNVRAIVELGDQLGARTLLIKQSLTLHYYPGSGLEDQWLSYAGERQFVEDQLEKNDGLHARQAILLIHSALMQQLEQVAAETDALLADGIRVLDQDREHQMVSYVHLSAEGNRALAGEIASTIDAAGLLNDSAASTTASATQ